MKSIRHEFIKMLFQKRTYIGWAGLFVVPWLVSLAFRLSSGGPHAEGTDPADTIMQLIRGNGIYVGLASLFALATFFLPLLASMSGSYAVAGEAENGTLRTTLMQPIHRGTMLLSKWVVANVYVAIGLLILAVAGLVAGGAFFGLHPMRLLTGQTVGIAHGIGLIAACYLFVLLAMAAVVSLAFFFSTLTNSSLTAVAGGLILVIIMEALQAFSQFDFLQPYLFTHYFSAWTNLPRSPVVWDPVAKALVNFVVWTVGMTGLGYLRFRRKDILS
ncbi:MAG: hypothetical protein A2133_03725 [Actinobacteria bacterium RBG_16_64_13]|nr:MAG: hypothetical protein A2133_03725 [Actinobacteria bacterium RBG_16_64_13]